MHSNLPVAVISIVTKENKLLLLKRKNTPWMNWYWWVPGWRLDTWETMTVWSIRELEEEVWIKVKEKDIIFKSVIQHKDDRWERIYFAIHTQKFSWEPVNIEKNKCEKVEWFDIDNLPTKITPQVNICLNAIRNKIYFEEYWY